MENAYRKPESDLLKEKETIFSFSNLGVWRKVYLIINWIGTLLFPVFIIIGVAGVSNSSLGGISIASLVIVLIIFLVLLGLAIWLHKAISKRLTNQIVILAIINLILFLNPISALILFAIRATSKKEVESAET